MPTSALDHDMFHDTLVTDEQITASSFDQLHPPPQARLSGTGWCSANTCNTQQIDEYLQINFGAELVVEAIAVTSNSEGFYVTQYMLEYAGSDGIYEYVIAEASSNVVSYYVCEIRKLFDRLSGRLLQLACLITQPFTYDGNYKILASFAIPIVT